MHAGPGASNDPLEVDEVTFGRLTDRWMDVIERRVIAALGPQDGPRLLGEIGVELQDQLLKPGPKAGIVVGSIKSGRSR